MRILCILVSFLFATTASAHEYWLEPPAYVLPADSTVTAGLFNGQIFKGMEFAFLPKNFRRFELAQGDRIEPVKGRLGDIPALAMPPLGEGLHVALYKSSGDMVMYKDMAAFGRFVTHKNFPAALARHADRRLPLQDFREYYTRHAKSLIAVGNGAGQDRAFGMETEIVALKNPYTDDISQGLPVKVLYQASPRADVQVEYFDKNAAGEVVVTLHQTDAEGVALLPVTPGHSYLVDAVVLREPAAGSAATTKGAVWESLWAALTFAMPQ